MDNKSNITLTGQLDVKIVKSGPLARLGNKRRKTVNVEEIKPFDIYKSMRG